MKLFFPCSCSSSRPRPRRRRPPRRAASPPPTRCGRPRSTPTGGSPSACAPPGPREVAVAGEWMRPGGRGQHAPEDDPRRRGGLVDHGGAGRAQHLHLRLPRRRHDRHRSRQPAGQAARPHLGQHGRGARRACPGRSATCPTARSRPTPTPRRSCSGATRQVVVYTPPGYDKNRATRYPILYLLHGNNDLAVGWTMAGRANLILDNLHRRQEGRPHDRGHALGPRPALRRPPRRRPAQQQRPVRARTCSRTSCRWSRSATGWPPAARNRAIVGLSMGGAQALQIGLRHRDLFASIGVFGAGLTRADFDARYGELMTAPARPANKLDLFFVGIAREDGAYARAKELVRAPAGPRPADHLPRDRRRPHLPGLAQAPGGDACRCCSRRGQTPHDGRGSAVGGEPVAGDVDVGETEAELGAPAGGAGHLDVALVVLDDAGHRGQAPARCRPASSRRTARRSGPGPPG